MKIKYEMLKKSDSIEMFKNVDEFYKMLMYCTIDSFETNSIHDCLQLSFEISVYYDSFEAMRNILKLNNIIDYVIAFDAEHEKIYIYDKKHYNVFYVDYDNIFCNKFSLSLLNETNKCMILTMILNCMLND